MFRKNVTSKIAAIVKRRSAPEHGVNLDTYNLAGGNWCIALLASHYVTNFIQISMIALKVLVKMVEPVVMELVNIPVNVFVDSLDRVARQVSQYSVCLVVLICDVWWSTSSNAVYYVVGAEIG